MALGRLSSHSMKGKLLFLGSWILFTAWAMLLPGAAAFEPNLGYALGNGELWKHAQVIVTGDFTGSKQDDMIVKWSDGEVTLYQGGSSDDLQRPFQGETQLAKPGSIWSHVKGMANMGNIGVIVLWSDGELSFYGRVSKAGFGEETQLLAPNALWRDHAAYITGLGVEGIVVVWSDGEVTLYDNILGEERQLMPPNDTWRHVRGLANYAEVDLIVRWSDGELTDYKNPDIKGLPSEHQLKPPNDLWTHATVIATLGQSLLVRWVDGELSLYPRFRNGISREIQLVAP